MSLEPTLMTNYITYKNITSIHPQSYINYYFVITKNDFLYVYIYIYISHFISLNLEPKTEEIQMPQKIRSAIAVHHVICYAGTRNIVPI